MGMKLYLYAMHPIGHGSDSFFVVAYHPEEAWDQIQKFIAENDVHYDESSYEFGDDGYPKFEVLEPGGVAYNDNE